MISKEKFLTEFYSIVKLLREHDFLRYSDRLEYELKEKVAASEFLKLIYNRTGQKLPGDYRIIKINEIKSASFASAKQIMKKVYLGYKKKSAEFPPDSLQHRKFKRYAELWEKAISLL
jgi:hypothetical protein